MFTFQGSVITEKNDPYCGYQLQLTKNGEKFATTANSIGYYGYRWDHLTTSMTGLANLNVGDRVAVKVLYQGDNYTPRENIKCYLGIKPYSSSFKNFGGGAWSAQFTGYLL